MGAEKWLDIELWNSTAECFRALKKRGYRIATTCLGTDSVGFHSSTSYISISFLVLVMKSMIRMVFIHCMSFNAHPFVVFGEKQQLFFKQIGERNMFCESLTYIDKKHLLKK